MMDSKPPAGMWQLYKMGGITPALASVFNPQNAQQMAFIRSIAKEQRKNSLYDIRLDRMEAVVCDLETTGFWPSKGDEIISVGAVVTEGRMRRPHAEFYSAVNPQRTIPRQVVELTGITNEQAVEAPDLMTVLTEFLAFAGSRVLIVHGSGHDKQFLNAALWKTSKIRMTHRMLDTILVAKWLHPKRARCDLDSLLDYYGIRISGRHHALEDSRMTADMWGLMLEEIRGRDIGTLGDLYTQLSLY